MRRGYTLLVTALLVPALAVPALAASVQSKPKGKSKPGGRVLKLEELSFTDIDKIDRAKSIFFLTFGNLEEHGPHLPVGSDYFQAIGLRDRLVARLRAAHPDYDFVIVPAVPLGEGGANNAAKQPDHIGTFPVRYETLRNVAIDLGGAIARKGFQNIFIVHFHGPPLHNIALNEAAAFITERYKARMVNITSLIFAEHLLGSKVMEKHLGAEWVRKTGFESHAGAAETSTNLYLRGDLVKPGYRRLRPFLAKDLAEFLRTYERTGWEGYWGDPAEASRGMGRDLVNDAVERAFRIAEKALAGEDLSKLPLYPHTRPDIPEAREYISRVGEIYTQQTSEIEAWLQAREKSKE